MAYFATSEGTAKQMGEAEWSEYRVSRIDCQQFLNGSSNS
jgi:hypothetical protein